MASKTHAPTVLIVDDNVDLLHFLTRLMAESSGWNVLTAKSARSARKLLARQRPDAALIDYMLPDGNGIELGVQLRQNAPHMQVVVMTGSVLPPEEQQICEEHDYPILRKPFLASDVIKQIGSRLKRTVRKSLVTRRAKRTAEKQCKFGRALTVLVCYSHRDEKLRDKLAAHLSTLRRTKIILWHDRNITAGTDFDDSIGHYLETADLILLLISPDFLNSDYCYKKEMKSALARHRKRTARVIPIILRPVDWDGTPFAHLLAVPKDGKPITRFTNRDDGYLDAAKSIRTAVEELSATIRRN